jgi:hypothetical protein
MYRTTTWLPCLAAATFLVACSTAGEHDPEQIERALFGVIADVNSKSAKLTERCIRMQGFKDYQTPKLVRMWGKPGVAPAKELAELADAELGKRVEFSAMSSTPSGNSDLAKAKYGEALIDGVKVSGGCTAWASNEARTGNKFYELSVQYQNTVRKQAKELESLLVPLNRDWRTCLSGPTQKMLERHKISSPTEFGSSQTDEVTSALAAPTLPAVRTALRKMAPDQQAHLDEVQRCLRNTKYEARRNEIRSKKMKLVFSGSEYDTFIDSLP